MSVRLAFAVAIHVDPEILLVDEALAVGDIYFRQRCMRKVHEMRSNGVTILFVSHSMGDVKAIGDRCMWLDAGRVRESALRTRLSSSTWRRWRRRTRNTLVRPSPSLHSARLRTPGHRNSWSESRT
jgi:ABC-type glutathione transport system ATPase component